MSPGSRLLTLLSLIAFVVGGTTVVAQAAEVTPTELTLAAQPGFADTDTTLQIRLTDDTGAPVVGAQLSIERRADGAWSPVSVVTTDADGSATQPVTLSRSRDDNQFRASYAGDQTYAPATEQARVELERRASRITIGGPAKVKDGRSVPVVVRWTTLSGEPVVGGRVRMYRSLVGGRWRPVRIVTTGDDGRATVRTTPREDSRWRAKAVRQAWVSGDRSKIHRIDNLPPGIAVKLPAQAPSPRIKLPVQGHAVGHGPNVKVTHIPNRIWSSMTGVSWRQGCPVGRAGLRLVRVNYWDYQGYARRGELVASADAAQAMGSALAEMFQRNFPIRAMYRVDRFGYGARSRGGDDYNSMAAGNTSAFNCRDVTGRPGVRSPHSYGRSLDLNTWENPYRSAQGTVPNTWWQGHTHPRVAWRSRSHPVVQLMARHGFRWTYGTGDTQHFDYVGGSARAMVAPRACDQYCD